MYIGKKRKQNKCPVMLNYRFVLLLLDMYFTLNGVKLTINMIAGEVHCYYILLS
jgi:hypothetical protein